MAGESDSDDLFQQHIELQNETNTHNSKINAKPVHSANDYINQLPKHAPPQHQEAVSYSFDAVNIANAQRKQEPSFKIYCIAGYRIIIHLLLLYAVSGVSYLLFIDECEKCNSGSSINPTFETELSITATPTPSIGTILVPTNNISSIQASISEVEIRITGVEDDITAVNQSHIADFKSLNDTIKEIKTITQSDIENLYSIVSTINASFTQPVTILPSTTANGSISTYYGMKYVVFNGRDCNIAGVFGVACLTYSSDGILEVIRESTGTYKVYWTDPYPNNNYVVITTSNGNNYNGSFAALGGSDDVFGYFGVSRYFVSIVTRTLGSVSNYIDSDYIVVVAQPGFDVSCSTLYF